MTEYKEINVPALNNNIDKVVDFINLELEKHNCPIKAQTQIDVAIDEIFSNISNYAYNGTSGNAIIRVSFEKDEPSSSDLCVITFIDNGIPYNPLENEDPDTTLSAEERGIGGLGIFIVKKSMDNIEYLYKNNQNILTITKRI